MPYNYYCFMKQFDGVPVEFVAIDTDLDKMKNRVSQENGRLIPYLKAKVGGESLLTPSWTSFGAEGKMKKPGSKWTSYIKNW